MAVCVYANGATIILYADTEINLQRVIDNAFA